MKNVNLIVFLRIALFPNNLYVILIENIRKIVINVSIKIAIHLIKYKVGEIFFPAKNVITSKDY